MSIISRKLVKLSIAAEQSTCEFFDLSTNYLSAFERPLSENVEQTDDH